MTSSVRDMPVCTFELSCSLMKDQAWEESGLSAGLDVPVYCTSLFGLLICRNGWKAQWHHMHVTTSVSHTVDLANSSVYGGPALMTNGTTILLTSDQLCKTFSRRLDQSYCYTARRSILDLLRRIDSYRQCTHSTYQLGLAFLLGKL